MQPGQPQADQWVLTLQGRSHHQMLLAGRLCTEHSLVDPADPPWHIGHLIRDVKPCCGWRGLRAGPGGVLSRGQTIPRMPGLQQEFLT